MTGDFDQYGAILRDLSPRGRDWLLAELVRRVCGEYPNEPVITVCDADNRVVGYVCPPEHRPTIAANFTPEELDAIRRAEWAAD